MSSMFVSKTMCTPVANCRIRLARFFFTVGTSLSLASALTRKHLSRKST